MPCRLFSPGELPEAFDLAQPLVDLLAVDCAVVLAETRDDALVILDRSLVIPELLVDLRPRKESVGVVRRLLYGEGLFEGLQRFLEQAELAVALAQKVIGLPALREVPYRLLPVLARSLAVTPREGEVAAVAEGAVIALQLPDRPPQRPPLASRSVGQTSFSSVGSASSARSA